MTQQAIQPANAEQIAAFKIGAAQRYKELGVKPADADRLFNAQMSKIAKEVGLEDKPLSERAQKVAESIKKTVTVAKK